MNTRAALSLSAIAAVLVLGVAYMTFGVLNIDPRRDYLAVELELSTSGGLGPGAPVLLNGIAVGRAESVRKQASGVLVALRIDERYPIPVSSRIRVEQLSALGEPYIGFDPIDDAGPYLTDGQHIPAHRVPAPMTITTLSTRLIDLLDQIRPEVMAGLVDTFDRALADTEATMQTLRRSTTLLAATLLSRTDRLRQLFADLQFLGADIDWMGPSLGTAGPLFGEFGITLSAIVQSGSALVDSRPVADYFSGSGVLVFVRELEALLAKIGPSAAALGPMLQPVVRDAVATAPDLDLGALLDQALHGLGDDTVHLRIGIK
ncbi:MlaD family protein [Nocardia rosealba]|uniref:MlaD family protein n=1 Tax=Nocardia rosealba TaxID=2878563 RepID=UPI001CDA0BAE|nr:MlaD family protein [Nocardia rosealba]MCA2207998.1 MlaD family protein [Nocardia rosealba]